MILYELKCPADHHFEGWFRNSDAYDAQAAGGEIACPVCGDTHIAKAPMAPRVARSREAAPPTPPPTEAVATPPQGSVTPGTAHRAMATQTTTNVDPIQILRAIRRHIEANFTPVGADFAEEARKIHYGEVERRAIYGDATPEEAEALADEGIDIAQVPWVPPTDS
ncbi:MAG TPA: DUF1178 family protein [Stellaceae bacterium]|nr:DUF1178 family protein [Stellaceae bacterium]